MNQQELQATKNKLEMELLGDPRYAALILARKNEGDRLELEKARHNLMTQVGHVISMAADRLSDVEQHGKETTKEAMGEFTAELSKIEHALKKLEAKEDTKTYLELKELRKELKKLAERDIPVPVVKVEAPKVDISVPEPTVINETQFVQETKYQEKLVALVDKLIEIQKDQSKKISKIESTGKIRNEKVSEAIPVVLTDKRGKKFQDLGDLQSFIAGGGGGGGVAGDNTDLDSGTGTDQHSVVAIGIPASGGHVIAGTTTNPWNVTMPDVIGTDGSTGPTKAVSIGGTDSSGNLQEWLVNSNSSGQVVGEATTATGTAAALDADAISSQDVLGYQWAKIQITGTWVGTLTFQSSNNDSIFNANSFLISNATSSTNNATNTTTNGQWHGPLCGRYFRVRMTSYTSGTATANVVFSTIPSALQAVGGVDAVGGTVADDIVLSGNPISIGAVARSTNRTPVGNGDMVRIAGDLLGRLFVTLNQPRALKAKAYVQLTSASETSLIAAGGANIANDLTLIHIANTSAAAISVTLRDATAGTARMIFRIPANDTKSFAMPDTFTQATANNAWTVQSSSATGDAEVSVTYVILPSNI